MKSQALTSWIQILTGFAVLAGLGLVVWELQQTRDLVRAQLECRVSVRLGHTTDLYG